MTKKRAATEPLRGEAAWQAAKADMAKRNGEARDRFEQERAPHTARRARERAEHEQLESGSTPR